jgi:hypothetical protein
MFGPISGATAGGGGGAGPFGLMPQSVGAGDNDLTRTLRAGTNLLGMQGPAFIGVGGGTIGTGLGTTQAGLDVSRMGLQTLKAPIDFYTKILAGDRTATALAPTPVNTAAITSGATN